MTTTKNPGEGVPKETPARNSLDTLQTTVTPVFGNARAAALIKTLRSDGYFDRSLMQQVNAAVQAIVAASTSASEKQALLAALKDSPSDRMRGYAAAVAFAFFHDTPERCLRELYTIGTLPGTWAQESAQAYVKRLMQLHGTLDILPLCAHWIADEQPEARRLLVEALRPRGVWTGHLPDLRSDPKPLKPLLELVLDDDSDYVRKAVANCINDISKDRPDLVCKWVKRWFTKKSSQERIWILNRGMRSLLKAGHPDALEVMGFSASAVRVAWDAAIPAHIAPGQAIPIGLSLVNEGTTRDAARVQIVLEAPGRGRSRRRTVYQIAQVYLTPGIGVEIIKRIPFRHRNSQPKIPGTYRVTLQVNGQDHGVREFKYLEP